MYILNNITTLIVQHVNYLIAILVSFYALKNLIQNIASFFNNDTVGDEYPLMWVVALAAAIIIAVCLVFFIGENIFLLITA